MTAALILIVALIPVVAVTALAFARIRPVAAALLLPYLAWLLFAATLNFAILQLNPHSEAVAPGSARTQIRP